jgi:hypothetical protein
MAFLNIPYGEDAVQRAIRGRTPPFLPPALETPTMPPPPLSTPVYGDVRDELARANELEASRPKPGFWRKIGAAALGAAAGYANQDPKLQQPIDPTAAQDFILYGDHGQKVAEQQGRIGRAKEAATIAEKEARLAADLESERARKASYEATAEARRASMNQPPKLPAPPSTYEARLVRDLDSPDPTVREAAQKKLDALKAPAPPKLTTPIPGRDVPYSPEVEAQRRRMAAANRAPERPTRGTPKQFADLDKNKSAELLRMKKWADDQVYADPANTNSVYAELRNAYQEIQNDYERQIKSLGGEVEHFEYPSGAEFIAQQTGTPVKPRPAPQPAPQQTPKQLTVEKASEYLRKAGGNKDLAREMARKDGWNF